MSSHSLHMIHGMVTVCGGQEVSTLGRLADLRPGTPRVRDPLGSVDLLLDMPPGRLMDFDDEMLSAIGEWVDTVLM